LGQHEVNLPVCVTFTFVKQNVPMLVQFFIYLLKFKLFKQAVSFIIIPNVFSAANYSL